MGTKPKQTFPFGLSSKNCFAFATNSIAFQQPIYRAKNSLVLVLKSMQNYSWKLSKIANILLMLTFHIFFVIFDNPFRYLLFLFGF